MLDSKNESVGLSICNCMTVVFKLLVAQACAKNSTLGYTIYFGIILY